MSPATRRIVAMLKMRKRLLHMLRQSSNRVASSNLRKKIAKLSGALEVEMDRLTRAQFLEGMYIGPNKEHQYPSRKKRPREALARAALMMEQEGATPEAIKMWTTPKNTKFFVRSWQPAEALLDEYELDAEDVMAWMVSGLTPTNQEVQVKKKGFSNRLYERMGQDHFKGDRGYKAKILFGDLSPREVATYAKKRVYHKSLNLKKMLDTDRQDTDRLESNTVRSDDTLSLEDTIGGGDVFDQGITRDDALLDLMGGNDEGANAIVDGLIRSVSSDRDRAVLEMVMDVAGRGSEFLESTTDIDEIVAERYRAQTGEPLSPRQVSNIRRKNISKAMKPAYDAARVLADAIDEAGGSSSGLREIMVDNLLDTEEAGPRLYDILPRAYSGSNRNKFWKAFKDILVENREFLVSYEDLLQRMVEEVDPNLTSQKLIRGLGVGGTMLEEADDFVKMLAEDLIALLMPIAEGMGMVDDRIFLKNELEMGRIRRAAKRVASAYLKKKAKALRYAAKGKSKGFEEIDLAESDMEALDAAWESLG